VITSEDGKHQIKVREGVRYDAYLDSKGIPTIGVGHTSAAGAPAVTLGMKITPAVCDEILARDLRKFENAVNGSVKVSIRQNQFDALTSFCFNIGEGGFRRSTVVRKLNAGDVQGAAHAFMLWNKPPEIRGRRASEMRQFSIEAARPDVLRDAAKTTRAQGDRAQKQGTTAIVVGTGSQAGHAPQAAKHVNGAAVFGLGVALVVVGVLLFRKYSESKRHADALEYAANDHHEEGK
jgi:lysozyme